MNDVDLGPEPARSIYERVAAAESVRVFGGLICDWCLMFRPRNNRGHGPCKKAWLEKVRRLALERAERLRLGQKASCAVEVDALFNEQIHRIRAVAK